MRSPRFRQKTPQVFDDGAPIPPEWDLHCEECDYNLTGLTSRRCPECGRPFKPRDLWSATRQAFMEEADQTPLYLSYMAVGLLVAAVVRLAFSQPAILAPFVLSPLFEFFTKTKRLRRARARIVVLVLCCTLSLAIWFSW